MVHMVSLAGMVGVVTGASRGLGYFLALGLARRSCRVVAVARTQGGLAALDEQCARENLLRPVLAPMDLLETDRIAALGYSIHRRFGRCDILVGNAALLGPQSPVGHIAPADWARVFALNVGANQALIHALEGLLALAPQGYGWFMTSGLAGSNRPFLAPYAASKAALETMVASWRQEHLHRTTLSIGVLDPGIVATRMRAQFKPGEDPSTLTTPDQAAEALLRRLFAEIVPDSGRLQADIA